MEEGTARNILTKARTGIAVMVDSSLFGTLLYGPSRQYPAPGPQPMKWEAGDLPHNPVVTTD